jgi:hypothetical protein
MTDTTGDTIVSANLYQRCLQQSLKTSQIHQFLLPLSATSGHSITLIKTIRVKYLNGFFNERLRTDYGWLLCNLLIF